MRVPHEDRPGRRWQEVRTFATTTRSLLELQDWLVCQGVTQCVTEATSTYWKPPFYLLEGDIDCWVVNAPRRQERAGQAEDELDAVWLCKLAEQGCCARRSCCRRDSGSCGTCAATGAPRSRSDPGEHRAEKLLEAQIKLSAVISDIFGKSGRDMLEALIAGQRDRRGLAKLARGSMSGKISVLQEALTGHLRDHHGYLLRMMCDRVDALTPRSTRSPRGSTRRSPLSRFRWPSWMRSPASAARTKTFLG